MNLKLTAVAEGRDLPTFPLQVGPAVISLSGDVLCRDGREMTDTEIGGLAAFLWGEVTPPRPGFLAADLVGARVQAQGGAMWSLRILGGEDTYVAYVSAAHTGLGLAERNWSGSCGLYTGLVLNGERFAAHTLYPEDEEEPRDMFSAWHPLYAAWGPETATPWSELERIARALGRPQPDLQGAVPGRTLRHLPRSVSEHGV